MVNILSSFIDFLCGFVMGTFNSQINIAIKNAVRGLVNISAHAQSAGLVGMNKFRSFQNFFSNLLFIS